MVFYFGVMIMRELKFKVAGQQIAKEPMCDFSNIAPGTENYLVARFRFDKEWSRTAKVAVFGCLGKEYPAKIEEDACIIPAEALTWRMFTVRVVGKKEGTKITTGKIAVMQEGI